MFSGGTYRFPLQATQSGSSSPKRAIDPIIPDPDIIAQKDEAKESGVVMLPRSTALRPQRIEIWGYWIIAAEVLGP